ncbi:cysteine-rich secretory protein family domain-containing protein [Phthorimaea operculella]|nr:cysteine-rich secretory protein family domain-containing protein [Phthorimaea operculella]
MIDWGSGGLSAYEKQAIVDAHNRLRQQVALGMISSQPPAANMMEMVWDEELAATAQRWADQCTPAHDQASQREVGRWPVGQNLAATWTTRPPSSQEDNEPDFMKQINAWFDEVNIYYFRPISGGHGTGHYSQLVWGETSHVGCGFTYYYDTTRGYTKLYVCNYGPGGNVIGSNPYEKGSPACNAFGLSDSRKYSGLCSASYTSTSSYVDPTSSYISNPETYYHTETSDLTGASSTFRPLISIIKTASDLFTKPKSTGFRFGTIYDALKKKK